MVNVNDATSAALEHPSLSISAPPQPILSPIDGSRLLSDCTQAAKRLRTIAGREEGNCSLFITTARFPCCQQKEPTHAVENVVEEEHGPKSFTGSCARVNKPSKERGKRREKYRISSLSVQEFAVVILQMRRKG